MVLQLEFRFRRKQDADRFCKQVLFNSLPITKRNGAWSIVWKLAPVKCAESNRIFVRENYRKVFAEIVKKWGGVLGG